MFRGLAFRGELPWQTRVQFRLYLHTAFAEPLPVKLARKNSYEIFPEPAPFSYLPARADSIKALTMKPRDVLTCGGKHRIQPAWEPALRLDLLLVYSSEEPLRAVHLAPEKSLSRLCSCEYGFFNSPAPKSDQEAAGSLAIPVVRCGTPEGMPCGAIVPLTGWTAVL